MLVNHPIEPEELMTHLDGELPSERSAVVAVHLEECAKCQALANQLYEVSSRLKTWQVEPPGGRVERALAVALNERNRPKFAWIWSGRAAAVAVGAPMLVAVMLLSLNTFRRPNDAMIAQIKSDSGVSYLQSPQTVELVRTKNPLIARSARLELITREFEKARGSAEDIVKRHGGYSGDLRVSGKVLEGTLLVPTDQLDAVLSELRQLGRVESEQRSGEEVTRQYVDLEARLANARNSERRLTELLRQRTARLSDVLDVEKEIGRVRDSIERMEAEQKSLANRVEFATIQLRMVEEARASLPVAARLRDAAVQGYNHMLDEAAGLIMAVLSYGPAMLLWVAILFFPARWLLRRMRRPVAK